MPDLPGAGWCRPGATQKPKIIDFQLKNNLKSMPDLPSAGRSRPGAAQKLKIIDF